MVRIGNKGEFPYIVEFFRENSSEIEEIYPLAGKIFSGKYLQTSFIAANEEMILLIGMGKKEDWMAYTPKELLAKACKEMKANHIEGAVFNIKNILEIWGAECISACAQGAEVGFHEGIHYKQDRKDSTYHAVFTGISETEKKDAEERLEEGALLAAAVKFVRDSVNQPSNLMRPMDFARAVTKFSKHDKIMAAIHTYEELQEMGMGALVGIGGSSPYPPCLCVLRYMGNAESEEITALIGKGVTSDTGGYCLKSRTSMIGMNGDMAGGAVAAGVMKVLAERQVKINAVCVIPMCENRLSSGSLVPGDVITSFSGKTIEILNTDAEGRLILADAVSYAIKVEKASRIVDIATLTGAMINTLGFHVTGALSDSDEMWKEFEEASEQTGEHFCRLPYFKENERMIESKIADLKNMGENVCGGITAGLFIRRFAENKPWIHLDIAGSAYVDKPLYAFQTRGATGAVVDTLYRWLSNTAGNR